MTGITSTTSVALPLLALFLVSTSCSPALPSSEVSHTTTGEAFKDDSTVSCSALRPQTEPDLMGWDPGSRLNLNALRKTGVVAVRYVSKGCDVQLEVLSHCIGKDRYQYSAYSSTDTKMARNVQELYAELPLGAAKLTGRVKGDKALRTDFILVGMAMLPPGKTYERSDLSGPDCNRATHVISQVYLGGFAMATGEAQNPKAAADIFMASAGGTRDTQIHRFFLEGDPDQCKAALKDGSEKPLCSFPLRIGLLPLDVKCPEGSEWNGTSCVLKVTKVSCPIGTSWDGSQCVGKVTCPAGTTWDGARCKASDDVSCPADTSWDGSKCVARVSQECPSGTHFVSGTGCVPFVMHESKLEPPPSGRGPDMRYIPGGSFMMGSKDGAASQKPAHWVEISSFYMDKTEVTMGQYAECVRATQCIEPTTGLNYKYDNWGKSGRDDHPVTSVDWNQAKAFCEWAGKRLPTEAEWEYAARGGGKDIIYPWGDQKATCAYAVMNMGCSKYRTWPVCSKTEGNTRQGLCDMAGNVGEWVSDWYGAYSSGNQTDPSGPGSGHYRVVRSGYWNEHAPQMRASHRIRLEATQRGYLLGFRCAYPPK